MLITTNRLGDSLGAPSRFFIFKEDRMKRTLIRLMLLTGLLGCILAPSALAQRPRGGGARAARPSFPPAPHSHKRSPPRARLLSAPRPPLRRPGRQKKPRNTA